MKTAIAMTLAALALAGCAGAGGPRDRYERLLTPIATPGQVVAAELAFARVAQEKGQWTAFGEFVADEAVMFVPQPVDAKAWLKQQKDPAEAIKWQPHEVWSSCDGTLAATRGAWQRPDGSTGYFTTVWQRQKDGSYRWVLDQGDKLAVPLAAPDTIKSRVAECGQPADSRYHAEMADREANTEAADASSGGGQSRDGTLAYRYVVQTDGARHVVVALMGNGRMETVIESQVAAPTP